MHETAASCVDHADTAWVLWATMLVLLMIPALGLFEAGLLRAKSTTSVLTQVFSGAVLLCFLWQLFGFSLVFGQSWHGLIGSPATFIGLRRVGVDSCFAQAPTVPKRAYAMFQMMFAAIAPLLMTGSFAERLSWPAFVGLTLGFECFVYYPVAHWVWGGGWLQRLGVLDFAGGIVLHTTAGVGGLVIAWYIGPRHTILLAHGAATIDGSHRGSNVEGGRWAAPSRESRDSRDSTERSTLNLFGSIGGLPTIPSVGDDLCDLANEPSVEAEQPHHPGSSDREGGVCVTSSARLDAHERATVTGSGSGASAAALGRVADAVRAPDNGPSLQLAVRVGAGSSLDVSPPHHAVGAAGSTVPRSLSAVGRLSASPSAAGLHHYSTPLLRDESVLTQMSVLTCTAPALKARLETVAPSSLPLAVTGGALLWLGWFGFNAGSAMSAGPLATHAVSNTQAGAVAAGVVWMAYSLWLHWRLSRRARLSLVALVNGVIAGLAGITPACGFISIDYALLCGLLLGGASLVAEHLFKHRLHIDDALDVGAVHGVTGMMGSLLIGVFASEEVNPAGANGLAAGGDFALLGKQALGVAVVAVYSAVVTAVLCVILRRVVGLRVNLEDEVRGLDLADHDEVAYEWLQQSNDANLI